MEKELSGQMAMHNASVEACWGRRSVERPFGPAITPEEMEVVHRMEENEMRVVEAINSFNKAAAEEAAKQNVVNEPQHYKHSTFEVIDEMVLAFGIDATITFCILNAWKYRARAPYKDNMKQDMEKADRYMQYAHDLQLKKAKMDAAGGVSIALPLLKSPGKKPVSNPPKTEDKHHGTR